MSAGEYHHVTELKILVSAVDAYPRHDGVRVVCALGVKFLLARHQRSRWVMCSWVETRARPLRDAF